MTGGAGADDFRFARFDGFDRIRDFVPGTDDLVFVGVASNTVQARAATYSSISGTDVSYGTSGDHVFLERVALSQFNMTNDVIFA
jgi:hypothetical protein